MKRLVLLAGAVVSLLGSQTAQGASPATTWYWTENTMIGELRQDYSYDPKHGIPNDPWHYELNTVECRGYGPFVGRQGGRYFRRFVCTLTYVATDPAIPNYVDRTDARVTGRYNYQEYKPPPPSRQLSPQTAVSAYSSHTAAGRAHTTTGRPVGWSSLAVCCCSARSACSQTAR